MFDVGKIDTLTFERHLDTREHERGIPEMMQGKKTGYSNVSCKDGLPHRPLEVVVELTS